MSDRDAEVVELLTQVDFFSGLDPRTRALVAAAVRPRRYQRGQVLFLEGDAGDALYLLSSGAVQIFRTSAGGERALLSVVRPPAVLGEVALLDGAPRSASAEALEDTTALALTRRDFLELFRREPALLDAVLTALGRLVRRLTDTAADHVFLDLPGRVAKALVTLAENRDRRDVALNQTQLAEMVGGSRQSVNQALGQFAGRGWVQHEGRRIVVTDVAALRRRGGLPG
jgi:CRP-like cAMP-binding protein